MAIEVSSPEVTGELPNIYCTRCGDLLEQGITVDGAFIHMLMEHPRAAEVLITRFFTAGHEYKDLIAWGLDIPEEFR